jgi:hypothetical protein
MHDTEAVNHLTDQFIERAGELGYSAVLVLIDPDEGVSVALSTENMSEATVCAGVLLRSILREGPPSCPHCLNNYHRVEAALRAMHQHPSTPEAVHLH